ncbi:hypothetical protein ACLD0U_03975 [Microbacterium sp. 2216-1]|uniref:hypothetical protein n=1 Tax=Microbacterium sp. 2216-1 TaxID=3390053 RepID=UPI003974797F
MTNHSPRTRRPRSRYYASETARETARGTGASGLASSAARWTIVVAWFCIVASGVLDGAFTPLNVWVPVAYLAAFAGIFALTDARDSPLLGARALAVPALSIVSTLLILLGTQGTEAYWLVNFASYLTALQIARGNTAAGLSGAVLQAACVGAWAVVTEQSSTVVVSMLTIPATALILSAVWRTVLRGIVQRERSHRSDSAEAERVATAAATAAEKYRQEFESIGTLVRPTLQRISAGEPMTDDLRTEVVLLEARVRDRIRATRLQHPLLVAAASRARSRGITVTMLSDAAELRMIGDEAARTLAGELDAAGAVTRATISTTLRDPSRITLVLDGPLSHRRLHVRDISGDEPRNGGPALFPLRPGL